MKWLRIGYWELEALPAKLRQQAEIAMSAESEVRAEEAARAKVAAIAAGSKG